jgi:protein phosphatase
MTDKGQKRDTNQDYLLCESNAIGRFPNSFMLADGMGGHNAGEIASKIGIEQVRKHIESSEKITPISIWEEALQNANEYVYRMSQDNIEYDGMGTTFVGVTIFLTTAYIANIGDSRLYHMHDHLRQITEDHSLVEEMLRSGKINKEEKKTHPNKNIITRALGSKKSVKADFFEVDVKSGDVILLCSDGLSNMLEDYQIENIIKENIEDMQSATTKLVRAANEAGGIDNISVILILV